MGGLDDAAVFQVQPDVGAAAHLLVVRHHQDGAALLMEVGEQIEHDLLVGGVQVAGGLVGQNDFGIVHQRAGDGTRCCSPPESCDGRWWARSVRPTRSSAAARFGFIGHAVEVLRQHHVFERGEMRDQMELLEDEAHGLGAKAGQLGAASTGGVHAVDAHRALVAWSRQPRMFSSVVLPEPEGPMMAIHSPASAVKLTRSSAFTGAAPRLRRPW